MKFLIRATPYFLVGFLSGVFVASFLFGSVTLALCLLFVAFTALISTFFYHKQQRALLIALTFFAAGLGVFRYINWDEAPRDQLLQIRVGAAVSLVGLVDDAPDTRETGTRLTLLVTKLSNGTSTALVHERVLLIANRYPEYHYGDVLEVKGVLKEPEVIDSGDGRIFNYPMYLKTKGIAYQIFHPAITKSGTGEGNIIYEKLFELKFAFLRSLASAYREPENALAGGILLGEKRSLGDTWTQRFRDVGIIHIIVLSGYNMTIVAQWLGSAFLFLGFYGSLAMSSLGIILFSLMAGGGATVVRAAIMALLTLLARLTGRTYIMGRALLFAGAGMVAENPGVLAFDPSFQLSFLATIGLIYAGPYLETKITLFKKYKMLHEVFVTTCATQVFVLPLLVYQMGNLSLISLLANVLVLPTIPLTMLATFVAGVIGFLSGTLAFIVGLPGELLLKWILIVGEYGAKIPLASILVPPFPGWIVLVLYALLAYFFWRIEQKNTQ